MESPQDADTYSSPKNISKIPFPFCGRRLPTERFKIQKESFDYMGREQFANVLETINKLVVREWRKVFVYGTIGYGKSHILAAMACFLIRQGKKVVYLPDCRAMADEYLSYIQESLLLTFVDSEAHTNEILNCTSDEKMKTFCKSVAEETTLYFIVDQINALDSEECGNDEVTNETKAHISQFLRSIACDHFLIKSASANVRTARQMQHKQTGDLKLTLMGGFTKREMQEWWTHNKKKLPEMSEEVIEDIEDLTGSIPLLLLDLLDYPIFYPNEDFKGSKYLLMARAKNAIDQVRDFAHKQHSKNSLTWNKYKDAMDRCLRQRDVVGIEPTLYDHRYFFIDERQIGHYTCGLARESMSRTLLELGEHFGLGWITHLMDFKSNRVMLGFCVEQICLTAICQTGLRAGGMNLPPMPNIVFNGSVPIYDVLKKHALYVPRTFNFKSIDGLIVEIKDTYTIHLIPIQITIAKSHSRSENNFYPSWELWTRELKTLGYSSINTTFLWITEGEMEWTPKEEVLRQFRNGRTTLVNPAFKSIKITVDQVHSQAGIVLAKARN